LAFDAKEAIVVDDLTKLLGFSKNEQLVAYCKEKGII
jgi:hypothetical protein